MYKYRLKYRTCGIGCQPNDFILHEEMDKKTTGFWGELTYNRKLSDQEIYKFELSPVDPQND